MKLEKDLYARAADFLHPGGDSLAMLFEFQRIHQAELGELTLEPIEGVRRNILRTIDELTELLHCFDWKWHTERREEPADTQRIIEETADCLLFLTNVLIHAGVESGWELRDGIGVVCKKNIQRLESGRNVYQGKEQA